MGLTGLENGCGDNGKWVWAYLHWNAGCNDETTCMEGESMGTVTPWL